MSKAELTITEWKDNVVLRISSNDHTSWHEIKKDWPTQRQDFPAYFSTWLQDKMRVLVQQMPFDTFSPICQKSLFEKYGYIIENTLNIFNITNDAVKKYQHLRRDYGPGRTLFINVGDDIRYKSFYNYLKDSIPDILYIDIESGFDRVKRAWGDMTLPMSLDDLINMLTEQGISKIVSVNHYFIDRYIGKAGLNLLPILKLLGIKYFPITHDPWELKPLGYLMKHSVMGDPITYFSGMSCLNQYWDKVLGMTPVYVPLPQDYRQTTIPKLGNDYDIIILSNSRLQNVKCVESQIKMLCDQFPKDKLFTDCQLWYMAVNYLVREVIPLTQDQRLFYCSMLHQFFFSFLQYLKHVIINEIKTDRKITVYGDEGWQEVCPQYYKGSLDNGQIETLYAERNHLYLLMNFSFSSLDASGPVYDVIRRGLPFVNVPPIVKTEELQGFNEIEYGTIGELNKLLGDCSGVFNSERLLKSWADIRTTYESGIYRIKDAVINDRINPYNLFQIGIDEHNRLMESAYKSYLYQNEPFIRATLDLFGDKL